MWSIGTVCDNKITWNKLADRAAAVGFVKSPETYESGSGKNQGETIVHRLLCASVVTLRMATGSQPPGWGKRETGGINPATCTTTCTKLESSEGILGTLRRYFCRIIS